MNDWSKSTFNHGSTRPEWFELIARLTEGKKSVLDLGCGIGRFTNAFKKMSYLGVDISRKNIKIAEGLYPPYPKRKFVVADITDWDTDRVFDIVFSWVSLQHIDPLYFEDLMKSVGKWGKSVMFMEHTAEMTAPSEYMWAHDYKKYLDITFKEPIVEGSELMLGKVKKEYLPEYGKKDKKV